MYQLVYEKKFKKDLKRAHKRGKNLEKLEVIINNLLIYDKKSVYDFYPYWVTLRFI
jgi:mRNA-degrading endonuclease YafQ of YafQ-DinJ toxin-antitoxin module